MTVLKVMTLVDGAWTALPTPYRVGTFAEEKYYRFLPILGSKMFFHSDVDFRKWWKSRGPVEC
jgi:hypothetical protein